MASYKNDVYVTKRRGVIALTLALVPPPVFSARVIGKRHQNNHERNRGKDKPIIGFTPISRNFTIF